MPETRPLTADEIAYLDKQGYDTSQLPDKVTVMSPDEIAQQQRQAQLNNPNNSSISGSLVRGAAASAIPTAVGGAAFVPGMEAGAALGSFGGPIGTAVGGLIGGGLTAYGGSRLASAGQNALLPTSIQQQLATDQAQHPIASGIGSLATLPLGGMNFNPGGTLKAAGGLVKTLTGAGATLEENPALINAAIGATMGGVQTAVQEKSEGKDLDPTQILINTAIGATFNKPNSIGQVYGFHPAVESMVNDPKAIASVQALDRFGRQDGQVVDTTPAIIPPAAQQDLEGTIFRAAGIPQANDRPAGPLYPSPAEQSANNIDQAYKEAADNAVKLQQNQLANTPVPTTEHEPAPEIEPLSEDEQAEEQATLKRNQGVNYQEAGTTKTPLQQEVESGLKANNLSPNLSPELQEAVTQEVMNRKGWVVNDQGALVDKSTGQPVRGQTLVADNVRKIALSPDLATADTPAHEGAHAVYQGLESAANNGDSRANDLLNQVNAKQKEGLDAVNAERAKKGLPLWDNEEYFADQQGLTFVKRQFNLDNENGWQRWWNDTKALLKTRWNTGSATIDDLRRAINYKMVNDSRFGALDSNKTEAVAGVRNQPNQEQSISKVPYGFWVSPDGKMYPVDSEAHHAEVAHEILKGTGDKYDSHDALMDKGWTRVVNYRPKNSLESENNDRTPITPRAKKAIKDYAIEHDINATHYHARGRGQTEPLYELQPRNQPQGEGLTPEDRKAIRKSGGEGERQPSPFNKEDVEKGANADNLVREKEDSAYNYASPERNQPKDEGLETSHMGFIGKPFQAALDTIREIPHPLAGKVANALHQTLIDRDHIIGKQWNSIADTAKKANLTKSDDARLASIFRLERETGASKAQMLQNNAQRQVYRAAKDSLETNYKYRLANKEPVYRSGVPTMPQRDEFYSPTTTNPKIAQVYRTNTDTAEIGRLNKVFVDYQTKKLGLSQEEAESNLKDFVERIQGNSMSGAGNNNAYFAGARRAQGNPLPEEFTRPGFMANMESYFRNQAMDNAFYKNVESNPEVYGALGEKHDAWMKPTTSPEAGPIAGNQAVRNVLNEIRGEATGGTQGQVIAKSESFATATLLGPLTEFHKLVSNAFKQFTYADNPLQAARVFAHAVTNVGEGWTHAKENGKIQMTARSASDMLNSQLAFADRLAGLTRGIRQVYTLGDLTEKWNMGLLQSGNEMLVPFKIKQANEGNAGAQLLMKHLDPQWQMGKTYSPQELSGLASELSGVMHGSRDARTLPGWMLHDNEISAFFKLSSWGIAQTNSFMRDVWTPATKGNFTPLIMATMGAAVGGYVIKDLREKIAGKHSQIPSLAEIQASSRGLQGNIPALAYNAMAAASYAGFGGMLSSIARYPFDAAFKNQPTGATFPLDQLVSSSATTISQVSEAIMNDPNLNWLNLATHAGASMITSNFQLGRIALNQAIDSGAISGQIAEKKMLSDKLAELRRFNMVEGLPYQDQGGGDENPYMNLQQKQFKAETDIPTAMKEAPALIQNIIQTYKSNPEIMLKKLEALKSNSYATMPDIDSSPLQFSKYVKFLTNYGGPQAAQAAIQDYWTHKVINEVKSSVIP